MFIPTHQQRDAIYKLTEWWEKKDRQIFEIAGYAGTGKTHAASNFIEEIGLEEDEVKYAAFTGKAALVLQRKGVNATTIHKLIYDIEYYNEFVLDKDGNKVKNSNGKFKTIQKFRFVKRTKLDEKIKLIILDECSMINQSMWDDIRSYDIPIIVLGDTQQLPPIIGEPVLLKNPDVELTQIVRQQSKSYLIDIATEAREGKYITVPDNRKYKNSNDVWIIYEDEVTDKILMGVDIILCGTNKKREAINNHIRYNILGRESKLPEKGDKLICRKNNWNLLIGDDIPLINGMSGIVLNNIEKESMTNKSIVIDFKPDFLDEYYHNIEVDRVVFESTDKKEVRNAMKYGNTNKFEFGYAITTHLSQGSEWDKVLIFEEWMGDKDYMSKWLYTAITRAKKKVIIVKKRH